MAKVAQALGLSAIVTLATAGMAVAADIYTPPAAAPAPIYEPSPAYSWDGHYFGIQGGGFWGTDDGAIGGLYGGWNWQQNWLVLGVDLNANYEFGDRDGFQGNIRGRAGVAHDRFLLYGTAGLAGIDAADFETGYTVGGGLEYAHSDNTSVRFDYAFTDAGGINDHTLMLGLAFKNWPGLR